MFERLFAEGGLSLDRVRSLLEVAVNGSIVRAAGGDAVRQSQYSRQIKELEDFFRTKLVQRHGKGIRLTSNGKELARISRFFMMGLSNFQRGCLSEKQIYTIGTAATFAHEFLLPHLGELQATSSGPRYISETVSDNEIERRLHDLTLDFGVMTTPMLSRPLRLNQIGAWKLHMYVPAKLCKNAENAARAFSENRLPLALAREASTLELSIFKARKPALICDNFLEARSVLRFERLATVLPDFLDPGCGGKRLLRMPVPSLETVAFHFHLAWNPRLLRLNPHADRERDHLLKSLQRKMEKKSRLTRRAQRGDNLTGMR